MNLRTFLITLVIFSAIIFPALAAQENDNFGDAAQKIDGQYFSIYLKEGVDISSLVSQLNISSSDLVLTGQKLDGSAPEKQLASMLDVLLNRACDVLDMHVYSFKGNVKVFATKEQLKDFFEKKFKTTLPCTGLAFYWHDSKSIYISAEDFKREVLGHEMGHAVMSSYFVVQPSTKIQEVLAGYVEYQLRKSK
jgi:hypothetical protein